MDERSILWRTLQHIMYVEAYAQHYYTRVELANGIYNGFTAILSSYGIVSWLFEWMNPLLCGAVIILAQVLSILKPEIIPFKRMERLRYFIPQLVRLSCEAERAWMKCNFGDPDKPAWEASCVLRQRFAELENEFISPYELPYNTKLANECEEEVAERLKEVYQPEDQNDDKSNGDRELQDQFNSEKAGQANRSDATKTEITAEREVTTVGAFPG